MSFVAYVFYALKVKISSNHSKFTLETNNPLSPLAIKAKTCPPRREVTLDCKLYWYSKFHNYVTFLFIG